MIAADKKPFRISDVPVHNLVDPRKWYRVRLAFGPNARWREFGPGSWVHDHDEIKQLPFGGEKKERHYRLEPAICEVEHLLGAQTNGLIQASNEWLAVNQHVTSTGLRLLNADNGQDRGTVNPLVLRADTGRMLVVLEVTETEPPPATTGAATEAAAAAAAAVKAAIRELVAEGLLTPTAKAK